MNANGPAIWGGCVTWRSHPATDPGTPPEAGTKNCPGGKPGMAHFLPSEYNFSELYAYRGTSLIGAANLSPVTKLVAGTGAVSRYKLSRSQKSVKVQDFDCGQMRVSGFSNVLKAVSEAVLKAKSVTNNLPILSVLAGVFLFIIFVLRI